MYLRCPVLLLSNQMRTRKTGGRQGRWEKLRHVNRGEIKKGFSALGIPLKEVVPCLPDLGVPFLWFCWFCFGFFLSFFLFVVLFFYYYFF